MNGREEVVVRPQGQVTEARGSAPRRKTSCFPKSVTSLATRTGATVISEDGVNAVLWAQKWPGLSPLPVCIRATSFHRSETTVEERVLQKLHFLPGFPNHLATFGYKKLRVTVCTWERGQTFRFRGNYQELLSYLRQLLWALAQLHAAGFFSRDIKPSNTLWDRHTWSLTLIDFDLAAEVRSIHTARLGTDGYMAPEVQARRPYGRNCDVWSAAVCVLGLLLCIPEREVMDHSPQEMLRRAEADTRAPPALCTLLQKMLHPDPASRPHAEQLLTDNAFF